MAFRARKNYFSTPVPYRVVEQVEVNSVDENGVTHSSIVLQDNSVSASSIPAPSDYRLEDLIAAGVPLQPVNCQLLSSLDDVTASAIVNRVINSDSHDTSDESSNPE